MRRFISHIGYILNDTLTAFLSVNVYESVVDTVSTRCLIIIIYLLF